MHGEYSVSARQRAAKFPLWNVSTDCGAIGAVPSFAYITGQQMMFFGRYLYSFSPLQTSPPASVACQSSQHPCRYLHRVRHLRADNLPRNILLFQHMHGVFRTRRIRSSLIAYTPVCGHCLISYLNTRAPLEQLDPAMVSTRFIARITAKARNCEVLPQCGSSAWIVNVGFVSSSTCAMTVFCNAVQINLYAVCIGNDVHLHRLVFRRGIYWILRWSDRFCRAFISRPYKS